MKNTFFEDTRHKESLTKRLLEVEAGRVGLYSIGLYPASLAYNCAMQTEDGPLLLAPRHGRKILGSFSKTELQSMDPSHVRKIMAMGTHYEGSKLVDNNLSDLILRCELVILSANSNHIENDLRLACSLREKLGRENVVLACLSGSFCHDASSDTSYVLCEKEHNLAFFSGFHRHGALRNPLDSFTANFTHPDTITAILGARLLDKLSPNLQVSSGVHNIEGQYIKAAKNISSMLAGFGHEFHAGNPGLLPTILTLLHDQCLDQAATVSMQRKNNNDLYDNQTLPLTELGYGVENLEATFNKGGDSHIIRDHTFAQLTAMVADVRGSMMQPIQGTPTRNFQAGQVLAMFMKNNRRCPQDSQEFLLTCENDGLSKGALEGFKSLSFWPQILKQYSIPLHDSSMINLLYFCIFGDHHIKSLVYKVMTDSREFTNYCQESVRPSHSRRFVAVMNQIKHIEAAEIIVNTIKDSFLDKSLYDQYLSKNDADDQMDPSYLKAMRFIEESLSY